MAALLLACAGVKFHIDTSLPSAREPVACTTLPEVHVDGGAGSEPPAIALGAEHLRLRDISGDDRLTPEGSYAVAWLPDGERLWTAGRGGMFLWDVHTGRALRAIALPPAMKYVGEAAASPDGQRLALRVYLTEDATKEHGLVLVDLTTEAVELLGRVASSSEGFPLSPPLSFSADGRRLILGREVWDVGARRRSWPDPATSLPGPADACKIKPSIDYGDDVKAYDSIRCPDVYLLPDGLRRIEVRGEGWRKVARKGRPGWRPSEWIIELRALHALEPVRRLRVIATRDASFRPPQLVFSESRRFVAELGATLRVWSTETGELLAQVPAVGDEAEGAVLSNDGRLAITWVNPPIYVGAAPAGASNEVAITAWDLRAGKPLWRLDRDGRLDHARLTPDDRLFLAEELALEARTGRVRLHLPAYTHDPSPSSAYGVSSDHGQEPGFDVRSLATGAPLFARAHRGEIAALSTDGAEVTRSRDGVLSLQNEGRCVSLPGRAGAGEIQFSPDGRWVFGVLRVSPPTVLAWDAKTGRLAASLTPRPSGSVLVLPGIGQAATQPDYGERYFFVDLFTGRLVRTIATPTARNVHTVGSPETSLGTVALYMPADAIPSSDGRFLVGGLLGSRLQVWNLVDGGPHHFISQGFVIKALALSPDNRRAVTGGEGGELRAWDLTTRSALPLEVRHADEITALAFSPDGALLASASRDRTLRLTDLRSGQPLSLVDLAPRHDYVLRAIFSRDGALLTTYTARGARLRFDVNPSAPPSSGLTK